jgi:hypothetical protein
MTNTAVVAADQDHPTPANNTATRETTINAEADLTVLKSPSDPVASGFDLIYTIVITNNGPSNATGVVLTDSLPGRSILPALMHQSWHGLKFPILMGTGTLSMGCGVRWQVALLKSYVLIATQVATFCSDPSSAHH